MKRQVIILTAILCLFSLFISSALADKSTNGSTTGGTMGKATGYAELLVTNSTSAGQDKVVGRTKSSIAESRNAVAATIYYVKGSGSGYKVGIGGASNGTTWASSTAKVDVSNGHGYKGTSSHSVSTTNYGSWSGSLAESW